MYRWKVHHVSCVRAALVSDQSVQRTSEAKYRSWFPSTLAGVVLTRISLDLPCVTSGDCDRYGVGIVDVDRVEVERELMINVFDLVDCKVCSLTYSIDQVRHISRAATFKTEWKPLPNTPAAYHQPRCVVFDATRKYASVVVIDCAAVSTGGEGASNGRFGATPLKEAKSPVDDHDASSYVPYGTDCYVPFDDDGSGSISTCYTPPTHSTCDHAEHGGSARSSTGHDGDDDSLDDCRCDELDEWVHVDAPQRVAT